MPINKNAKFVLILASGFVLGFVVCLIVTNLECDVIAYELDNCIDKANELVKILNARENCPEQQAPSLLNLSVNNKSWNRR